jgi:L-ribulose-5-phosphate 3-epimerase
MLTPEPMEIGLVFWAEQDAESTLRQLDGLGIHAGQLGVPPDMSCDAALRDWARALKEERAAVTSAVCSYSGEDYSNLETVHRTVGFTNKELRADRIARTKEVSRFADALGIRALSCHLGFIPSDRDEALYQDLRNLTRSLCEICSERHQDFVLETGQESADVLLGFIADVNRNNLKVNFDPANMIMYGSGDPLAALEILGSRVLSVHCKDAISPPADTVGLLGEECAVGDGEVDFPAFLKQLKKMNYQGLLTIEREAPNPDRRLADIAIGAQRLARWKAAVGIGMSVGA